MGQKNPFVFLTLCFFLVDHLLICMFPFITSIALNKVLIKIRQVLLFLKTRLNMSLLIKEVNMNKS